MAIAAMCLEQTSMAQITDKQIAADILISTRNCVIGISMLEKLIAPSQRLP